MTRPVHVHVHLVATGSFPLAVADLLFTDDGVVIPVYEYLTPVFGLARGGMETAGTRARDRYYSEGLSGLLDLAEQTHRVRYRDLHRVRIYRSRVGRPKIALDTATTAEYAYRVHAPLEVAELTEALVALGTDKGFEVERNRGIGYSLRRSLRRFLRPR